MTLVPPLELAYALAVRTKNQLYEHGRLQPHQLAWPVVSIGNLCVGGTGKTPFTAELARLLRAAGTHVDILSRGYGRRSPQVVERVPVMTQDAARYGDEPVLLARTGVPVYVGASRYQAGRLAEQQAGPATTGVHLLDDGFQHRKLARAVDMVLLRPGDATDALLPRGRLRESLAALRRADFLVLREEDAQTETILARAGLRLPIWRVRRSLALPQLRGSCSAFAAIAHPGEFFAQLGARVDLGPTLAFRDHHRFTPHDLRRIARAAQGSAAILTTEKDWVRLPAAAREILTRTAPLHAIPLCTELLHAGHSLTALLARLGG